MNPGTQQQVGRSLPGRLDGLWVGLLFLLVYEILRQRSIYGDGIWILHYGWTNVVTSNVHLLYLPLLRGLRWLLDPLGITVFQITSHLSCIATAVGIGLAHTAFAILGFSRRDAFLAAGLVGFTPGIVFYATIVEWQPLFFGLAGLAFVGTARMAMSPTVARAVQLGACTGIAYLAHASGVLLPLPLLFMAWAIALSSGGSMDRTRLLKMFAPTAAAVLAHAVVVWGIPFLLRSVTDSVQASVVHAQAMFSGYAATDRWNQLGAVLGTLGNEWFLAFAPMSIVCVMGIFLERSRLMTLGLLISLIPYLTVSVAMLAGHNEYGAYLLPLAFPLAWIAVRCYSGRIVVIWATLAAITSVVMVKLNDEPERGRALADGLRTVADGQSMALLIGEFVDLEARFVHLPETPYLHLTEIAQFSREEVAALMPQMDAVLEGWFVEGRRIFLTDRVEAVVQSRTFAGYEILEEVILAHLRREYDLMPVEHGGFGGKEVRRK